MTQSITSHINTNKVRNSNLELFRIIVMLLIIAHHYVVNSGIMEEMFKKTTSIRTIFLLLFGMWGKTGINCFILITGYFMSKSEITLTKFLKLFIEVIFYRFIIYFRRVSRIFLELYTLYSNSYRRSYK